ncbi:Methyltransferase domain-containing protein [Actinoplanes cyaneus]|nr:Methyltransferase domain-containing protein [Actinoplanes cyaneus]
MWQAMPRGWLTGMALIAYDRSDASAFAATRHLGGDALNPWREAITRHLQPRPGMRLLDLGCGTATWTAAFRRWWPRAEVVSVEPSAAMRERAVTGPVLPGHAADLPVADASLDGVWLSTVIHHVPDLPAAAREIRRVLRPGAPVLIRSAFPGRHDGITLCRFWPETITALERHYPSVATIETAFGLPDAVLEPVTQVSAPSLRDAAASLRREAHTLLQLITDEAYEAGLARLHAAARTATGPQTDTLDLLVLR